MEQTNNYGKFIIRHLNKNADCRRSHSNKIAQQDESTHLITGILLPTVNTIKENLTASAIQTLHRILFGMPKLIKSSQAQITKLVLPNMNRDLVA